MGLDQHDTPGADGQGLAEAKAFIGRWRASGGAENANSQLFLAELCDLLGVERPQPASPDVDGNAYVFERDVLVRNPDGSEGRGRIDLYKRGCFVLESKQGVIRRAQESLSDKAREQAARAKKGAGFRETTAWYGVMARARQQAENYIRNLPAPEGRPPFLLVADVGHSIEIYAEFTCTGGTYVPFPDPKSHVVSLRDLEREEVRALLRAIWTDPLSLDPSRRSARVTRDIADRLARLAKSLEADGHAPDAVAQFLMRCLFTMFAEDVKLLPADSFRRTIASVAATPDDFVPVVANLWKLMNEGGYWTDYRSKLLRFNGQLFDKPMVLPLNQDQIQLLLEAAEADWRDVEPAIFGTLLERALNPTERHKLGAHYTPRAYVERLVMPTVIEPLREEWKAVQAAVSVLAAKDDKKSALAAVRDFHRRLCKVRVLDPACGSGNFLYVTLEHMKRLEGEVLDLYRQLEPDTKAKMLLMDMKGLTVDPHQFLGIEVNPRAAAIAEMVLWIGYLQWHLRTSNDAVPPEPVLKKFHNIECRDALMDWDKIEEVRGEDGQVVTRWDGKTYKKHPVTGQDVPDETARVAVVKYVGARRAEWPEAEYIVGNPPFLGGKDKRADLGSGYFDALAVVFPGVPESADFVMYWWDKAARLVRADKARRFGFITTNSLRQVFNRKVTTPHMENGLSLAFAVPDHPWVDDVGGAAVRIAMSVGAAGSVPGTLAVVTREADTARIERAVFLSTREGLILPDLTIGPDVARAKPLGANAGLSCPGVKLHGAGFIVTPREAEGLGLNRVAGLEKHIRPYLNGRDLQQRSRGVMVIDLFGLSEEEVRERFPEVYQWLYDRIKPERDAKASGGTKDSQQYARQWWLFGKTRSDFRPALAGLSRFIATVETARHRVFVFLDAANAADNKLITIACDDAWLLGVLSSRIHVTWALAAGGRLGVGNDPVYVKTTCFEKFPFPAATAEQQRAIRDLGDRLDGLRKTRQAEHPLLTMTSMYNVLEKLRAEIPLTDKERIIYEQGLVGVLKELHDKLDAAVADAYGWPTTLSDEQILERLVALNRERAEEEKRGLIRWLRPEYQNPEGRTAVSAQLETTAKSAKAKVEKQPWPTELPQQVMAVKSALSALAAPADAQGVARRFSRAKVDKVAELLEALAALGQAARLPDGRYAAA